LALGSIWGASFLLIKVLLAEIGPAELVSGRLFFGTLAVLLVMAYRRVTLRLSPRLNAKISVLAILDSVAPFVLIAWAEARIDSGMASALTATMPLFTAMFAVAVLAEERLTTGSLLGLALGFAGVIALTGRDILDFASAGTQGQNAVLGAAACYAAAAVYARILLRSEDALNLSGLQLVLASLIALPLTLTLEGTPAMPSASRAGLRSAHWASSQVASPTLPTSGS
jgi:drug/metabolite transporter (DMT)-like permease